MLGIVRLLWRLIRPPPQALASHRPRERALAAAVHWAFYGILLGKPLGGWIILSTGSSNKPMLLYYAVPWPYFPGVHGLAESTRKVLDHGFGFTHEVLGYTSLALLVLHLGAVAKHHLLDGDAVLARMLPFMGHRSRVRPIGR